MKENEELKEAVEKLCTLSEGEKMQRIVDLREKAIMDEKAILARGEELGEKKKQIEIAKIMLADGESIEKIVKYTGLTTEEIKKIK